MRLMQVSLTVFKLDGVEALTQHATDAGVTDRVQAGWGGSSDTACD